MPRARSEGNRATIPHGKAAPPGAVHPHEMAVHFDRIAPSWEVEGALTLVEFDQHLALHVVDVGTLDHLGGTAGATKVSEPCHRRQRTPHVRMPTQNSNVKARRAYVECGLSSNALSMSKTLLVFFNNVQKRTTQQNITRGSIFQWKV